MGSLSALIFFVNLLLSECSIVLYILITTNRVPLHIHVLELGKLSRGVLPSNTKERSSKNNTSSESASPITLQ